MKLRRTGHVDDERGCGRINSMAQPDPKSHKVKWEGEEVYRPKRNEFMNVAMA